MASSHALSPAQPSSPTPGADPEVILAVEGVSKRFPGVLALDGVDFTVRRGEVHALCGENGAGKSTLMKVITGQHAPDAGRIVYHGTPRAFTHVLDAQRAGIAMIHQELNLVPHLSVAENVLLAREPCRGPFVDRAALAAEARVHLARIGLDVSPAALVKTLSVAQQQLVEIAKALSLRAEVLIMDEPTSSLTETEIGQLFRVIHSLRAEGVAVVYISHRLDELARIADRVSIFRDGRHVWTRPFAQVSVDEIVAAMVGRALTEKFPPRTSRPTAEPVLEVRNLARRGVFEDVSFELRRGEILGFAGLVGAGRTEVARAIFGADPKTGGQVLLHGRELRIDSPLDAIRHGIAYLSEDRKSHGLALGMSVAANVTMANVAAVCGRLGFLRFDEEEATARRFIASLEIKTPSARQLAKNLSGGNQQKVVISKWLHRQAKVLIFDEPTRGIDVGAKFAIYRMLDRFAAEGIGVIVISSELPEILGLTDRVVVFHEGRMTGTLETPRTDQTEIMHRASGRTGPAAAPSPAGTVSAP